MDALQSLFNSLLSGMDPTQMGTTDAMKFLLAVLVLQGMLRLSAEVLTRLSVKTEATWDNQLASLVSSAAWYLGAFLGHFGFGSPTAIVDDKIDQAMKALDESQKPKV